MIWIIGSFDISLTYQKNKIMKTQAIQAFEKTTGWKVNFCKEYKTNCFLIVADGEVTKGQFFKMVLTKSGWNLDAI